MKISPIYGDDTYMVGNMIYMIWHFRENYYNKKDILYLLLINNTYVGIVRFYLTFKIGTFKEYIIHITIFIYLLTFINYY